MNGSDPLTAAVLKRKAVIYVRQSTPQQVSSNLESQRRQYELVELARRRGFRDVEVIDDDLGISANGAMERPGFERLCAWLCAARVGAVLCFDASRLSRNGRDWHHLLELCGLFDARVIDMDGVYDPRLPNDRLLLGMKGSIFEFETGVLRARMLDALRGKACRGELRLNVPIGYVWHREGGGPVFNPDVRIQETIRLIFAGFRELGSARQVALVLNQDKVCFPAPYGRALSPEWRPIGYSNVRSVLKNPFYAGVYAWGKTGQHTDVVDGRARKRSGYERPVEEWEVLLKDHHPGYIDWTEYERNQVRLASNSFSKIGGSKSGRGGRALLSGLLSCARCGRRLQVAYTGRSSGRVTYRCDHNRMAGRSGCPRFSGARVDAAVAGEVLRVVSPMAIEAALEAERMCKETEEKQRQIVELELQQARYEASLAERRYAACDPDNRLIAAQLEKSWEEALRRVAVCEGRVTSMPAHAPDTPDFMGLADDLEAAWNAPRTTMRTRQQLLRSLVTDIVADVDETTNEVVLVIHWRGGRHSRLRVRKPASGEHSLRTPEETVAVIRSMAGRWSDADISASLNRMGMRTGRNNTWTAQRVKRYRWEHGILSQLPATGDDALLTMSEAAGKLRVNHHVIRRLIRQGILPAQQAAPRAPWRIRAADLMEDQVIAAAEATFGPCQTKAQNQLSMFSISSEGDSQ